MGYFKNSKELLLLLNNPVSGQGQLKSDMVTNDFASGLELTQQILALEGKQLTYDAAQLQIAINSQVAAYNAMAALKASFKVIPIPVPVVKIG